eukprot:15468783-Alexandrium_andersonii.AAC.2
MVPPRHHGQIQRPRPKSATALVQQPKRVQKAAEKYRRQSSAAFCSCAPVRKACRPPPPDPPN